MNYVMKRPLLIGLAFFASQFVVNCSGPSGSGNTVPPTVLPPPSGGDDSPPSTPPPNGAPVGSEIIVSDLSVGDCADSGNSNVLYTVIVADCSAPHEFEVIGAFARPENSDAAFPGRSKLLPDARITCRDLFVDLTGKGIDGLGLEIDIIYPSSSTWETGDRDIICLALAMDGEPPLERPVSSF